MKYLTCPIRGRLKIKEKASDNLTYTEEKNRIDLIRFLLNTKKYKKENFKFDIVVGHYGCNHRSFKPDIVYYKDLESNEVLFCAEIKRENSSKEDAIQDQLIPACQKTFCKYGIYADDIEKIFLLENEKFAIEHLIAQFPLNGMDYGEEPLKNKDLIPIENVNGIMQKLDQILHNSGMSKESKYNELFKIIQAKYFDEKENSNPDDCLVFQTQNNLEEKIKLLYENSKKYYGIDSIEPINLHENEIRLIVNLLSPYTLLRSKQDILQGLFMKFAQSTLKIELDQFYTPIDIVEFIVSLVKINNTNKIIDPAGGSADFLVGCLKKNPKCSEGIHYRDRDKKAGDVAKLNMILNGDGRSHLEILDTIENFNKYDNSFDLVITNPPFGTRTIFQGSAKILKEYKFFSELKGQYKQLGILYIERCMNLLKENGNLIIIVPNGYMTNPEHEDLRDYLLKNYRIVAYITLPSQSFKCSGTGVKPGILVINKSNFQQSDYPIFTDVANKLGFKYNEKKYPKLYKYTEDGEILLDDDNNPIIDSDFSNIANKFKKFCYDNSLNGFELSNMDIRYDSVGSDEIRNSKYKLIRPSMYTKEYKEHIEQCKKSNWVRLTDFNTVSVTNTKDFKIEKEKLYRYLEISNMEHGGYYFEEYKHGWELPERAKLKVMENDIFIGKLEGSLSKFCIILEKNTEDLIATNGCYRIRISDERIRLSFYKFLFSYSYKFQMKSLATGSIMCDVKYYDLVENLYFPILNNDELEEMRNYINALKSIKKIL